MLSRNLALAVKNSEMASHDGEKPADISQSQDMTLDVHCLRQVTNYHQYTIMQLKTVTHVRETRASQPVKVFSPTGYFLFARDSFDVCQKRSYMGHYAFNTRDDMLYESSFTNLFTYYRKPGA